MRRWLPLAISLGLVAFNTGQVVKNASEDRYGWAAWFIFWTWIWIRVARDYWNKEAHK